MIKYDDLINICVTENSEKLIVIDQDIIKSEYVKPMLDMKPLLGKRMLVRKSILKKLVIAQNYLKAFYPKLNLHITYGYRSPEVQTNLFLKQIRKISINQFFINPFDLYEKVHKFIAVPSVAGHPTGGAVDLLIFNKVDGRFLEFGSKIYDFSSNKCEVFSSEISKSATKNRLLLRRIMTRAGFAPYDDEWWHFSYGDREWAYYYKKGRAIYDQISIKKLALIIR